MGNVGRRVFEELDWTADKQSSFKTQLRQSKAKQSKAKQSKAK
jgi:hypothetical protein